VKCKDCYFWHQEAGFCCLKSQMDANECSDAIFDLVWDEEKQEPRRRDA